MTARNVLVVGAGAAGTATAAGAKVQLGQWLLDHEQGDLPGLIGRVSQLVSQPA
jgi:hypothetical protein